ncbi:uncharacterized protein Z519_01540 [Cladophialophora bantiana CBS 173.52]|uniref:Uncharacterized protein n=1 Tax=Cladophialophora bantiana (strain ATCC 10958 / CBS 173.52 / CDC B-1940 / NIH 8579) TaxID=1442370 RepID=A0A0D2F788_CLAB1|nr:uncharacterized protein Z519_01540 [Cladophialophora bantiana CBS 173.52]KIW97956.1 hypothetical protein Z519_01540 [Cladophialophora bantiana CBS 173.52]
MSVQATDQTRRKREELREEQAPMEAGKQKQDCDIKRDARGNKRGREDGGVRQRRKTSGKSKEKCGKHD